MIGEPGSKLDFATFISYILPGFIVEFVLFFSLDICIIYFSTRPPVTLKLLTFGTGQAALVIAFSVFLAYFFGLLLDACAHADKRLNGEEHSAKAKVYNEVVNTFTELVKQEDIKRFLKDHASAFKQEELEEGDRNFIARLGAAIMRLLKAVMKLLKALWSYITFAATKENPAERNKIHEFIDAVFYRIASAEIWTRQSWDWAFYEASRQLSLLIVPLVLIGVFYTATMLVCFFTDFFAANPHYSLASSTSFIFPLLAVMVLGLPAGLFLHNRIRRERKLVCEVYYRHRAYVVFAYLIQAGQIEHSVARIGLLDQPLLNLDLFDQRFDDSKKPKKERKSSA